MFAFPVTLVRHTPADIKRLAASVQIDTIAFVKPFPLDSEGNIDVESYYHSNLVPHTAIHLVDGRRLLVVEHPDYVLDYLDHYRTLDEDFDRPAPAQALTARSEGPSLRLIRGDKCDTLEASTPA